MNRNVEVGFSQRIQLEWLDRTAYLFMAGQTRDEIQEYLQEYLQDRLSIGSDAKRGNRARTISILLKIWVAVPDKLASLRDEGLELLKQLPLEKHLIIHWGMIMATYPFFEALAETSGRLLRLQGYMAAPQVQRRMREQLGERSTVERAVRRILRSFIDWGVIQETTDKGVYKTKPSLLINDNRIMEWLIEAALIASGSTSGTLRTIAQTPALFPFTTGPINTIKLESHGRLELFRQGLDDDVVMLRSRITQTT